MLTLVLIPTLKGHWNWPMGTHLQHAYPKMQPYGLKGQSFVFIDILYTIVEDYNIYTITHTQLYTYRVYECVRACVRACIYVHVYMCICVRVITIINIPYRLFIHIHIYIEKYPL